MQLFSASSSLLVTSWPVAKNLVSISTSARSTLGITSKFSLHQNQSPSSNLTTTSSRCHRLELSAKHGSSILYKRNPYVTHSLEYPVSHCFLLVPSLSSFFLVFLAITLTCTYIHIALTQTSRYRYPRQQYILLKSYQYVSLDLLHHFLSTITRPHDI